MKRFFARALVFLPAVLFCFALLTGKSYAQAAETPHKLILPDELPVPDNLEDMENLTVIIVNGTVCVTDKEGNVLYDTQVPSGSLTKADREMLEKGISASDYLRLIRLIENYTS